MADVKLTPEFELRFYQDQIPEFIRKYQEAHGPLQADLRLAYGRILQVMCLQVFDLVSPASGNRLQGESTGAGVKGGA